MLIINCRIYCGEQAVSCISAYANQRRLLTNMSAAPKGRLEAYIEAVPKIELHVHIEGTLEPAQMFRIGERNQILLEGTAETHRERRREASKNCHTCAR